MKNQKTIGVVLLVAGAVLLIVSLAADAIGLGVTGFGYKQIVGSVIGVIAAVVGYFLYSKK